MKIYKILVTGSRVHPSEEDVHKEIINWCRKINQWDEANQYAFDVEIIHGANKAGADLYADHFCDKYGAMRKRFPANWQAQETTKA